MAEYIKRDAIRYESWSVGPLNEPLLVVRKKTIDNLPTADVAEVRRGKWRGWHGDKMIGVDEYRHYHYNTCSECGKGNAVKSNYCPNCGARMDKEET